MEVTQTDGGAESPAAHIVMVPSPGMGHLIPIIEFAKRLLALNHHFTIIFAIPSDGPPTTAQNSVLNSLPPQIRHVFLPPVTFHDLPPNSKIDTVIALTVPRSLPSLRDLLKSILLDSKSNLVALVVDHFGIAALHVGKEFNLSSYIFVSFGSRGTLSSEQTTELAMGLEMSGQRFLWVVRIPNDKYKEVNNPNDKESSGSIFSVHSENDPLSFLPEGFVERNRGRGLVVPSWAAQARILGHSSTGGFLTHCGWNSTLESVVNGIPLIVWPLYAEQKMNAEMLTEETKVALRPKMNEGNGIVEKEEIAKVVKSLLEGEEGKKLRGKMKKLKEAAKRVVEEDGSSTKALSEALLKWNSNSNSKSKICV